VFWRLLNRQPSRLAYFVCPESRNANADFNFFRAVTRSQPFTTEKVALGLWWLSVTATPPPSHKKAKKNGFFAPLGCLFALLNPWNKEKPKKMMINTNALWLFAHFFRRLPKASI
jgi:hypothetical protein